MATPLENFERQRQSLSNQISSTKSKITKAENELGRLQTAQKQLQKLKDDRVSPLEKRVKRKNCADNLRWRGEYKDLFDKALDDMAVSKAKEFTKSVNNMLGELKTAINKKKSEISGYKTTLGIKQAQYNLVILDIRNYTK